MLGPAWLGWKKKVGLAFGLGYLGRGAWATAKEWEKLEVAGQARLGGEGLGKDWAPAKDSESFRNGKRNLLDLGLVVRNGKSNLLDLGLTTKL